MGKLFEALRRLIVASIYVGGVTVSVFIIWVFFQDGVTSSDNIPTMVKLTAILVCTLIAMPAAHKLVNWVLLYCKEQLKWWTD